MIQKLLRLTPKGEKAELKKQLEELDEFYLQIVEGCCKAGYTLKEAIQKIDDCYIYFDCSDMSDVARQHLKNFVEYVPEHLKDLINLEEYGKKMAENSDRFTYVFLNNGNCIEIENTNIFNIKENETMTNTITNEAKMEMFKKALEATDNFNLAMEMGMPEYWVDKMLSRMREATQPIKDAGLEGEYEDYLLSA